MQIKILELYLQNITVYCGIAKVLILSNGNLTICKIYIFHVIEIYWKLQNIANLTTFVTLILSWKLLENL